MARPQKKGLDYFPHDTDAVGDEKVEALTILYGHAGYAFYFVLLERIYRTSNFELDISDAETLQILSRKIGITPELFEKILSTALKVGCFDKEMYEKRKVLTSEGIMKRALIVIDKREKMRQSYIPKNQIVSDAETFQKPDKVKESKVKESINKDILNNKELRVRCGNVYLTELENEKILNQFEIKDRMVKSLKYVTKYSQLKTNGYIPVDSDFEEILHLIEQDKGLKI